MVMHDVNVGRRSVAFLRIVQMHRRAKFTTQKSEKFFKLVIFVVFRDRQKLEIHNFFCCQKECLGIYVVCGFWLSRFSTNYRPSFRIYSLLFVCAKKFRLRLVVTLLVWCKNVVDELNTLCKFITLTGEPPSHHIPQSTDHFFIQKVWK
jgi:hypothetical protein